MKALIFLNSLSLGGTEKAACLWARYLAARICEGAGGNGLHRISTLSLEDGPRRADLERAGVPLQILEAKGEAAVAAIADAIANVDVIHTHSPGFPHPGDILGAALRRLGRKISVVQTNIFGKLQNPAEDSWTDFRLFISWTSCVQAARRAGRKLDLEFFRRQSVASYPVEAPLFLGAENALSIAADKLHHQLGLTTDHVLFGRFSRPEPNKWTPLILHSFLRAHRINSKIRLLLREPPEEVSAELLATHQAVWHGEAAPTDTSPVILMRATSEPLDLAVSQMACHAVLHTSSIGESFGYGVAEPMALGKPVITNSVPWHDQAQIELVRHDECGLIASTISSMQEAILDMSKSNARRAAFGKTAQNHILSIANPEDSIKRIEMAMHCALNGCNNPHAAEDLAAAKRAADYLDRQQWGASWGDSLYLHRHDCAIKARELCRKVRRFIFRI